MMLPLKAGLLVAATSALILAAPTVPAASPLGAAPSSLVSAGAPVEQVRYRSRVHRRYYVRHRYHRRYYRYGYYNPGLALFGAAIGGLAAASAYPYGYGYYPYYGYPYPAYGWGW